MIKKTFLCLLAFHLFLGMLHAHPSVEPGKKVLTIYGIKGPSGIGMIRLFEDIPQVPGFELRVEALAQADLAAARFLSGEAQVGILPPNMAAKIASSGKNIKVAAVIGMGMLSLLTSDPQIHSLRDLRGKTVEVAGQGATPDYVFRRLLRENALQPDLDVRLGYSLAHPEIVQSLIANRISSALLPEPFATMALSGKPDLRQVGNIQDEWRRFSGGDNFPMTVLAIDGDFAANNPEAVRIILHRFSDSVHWTVSHPAEAGVLAEKHELGFPRLVAAAAIPKSNYVFVPAVEARPALENLFKLYLDFSPVSIGGALPQDSFYYQNF